MMPETDDHDPVTTAARFSDRLDLFRVVQTDDEGPGEMGDELGVGVEFPESGVYVDWNVDVWPDEQQLGGPHVSQYDSIADAATVAEGEVESLTTTAGDGTMLPMPDDAMLLYPDEGQAGAAAQDLGLPDAAHAHDLDGEQWWMPGADHQAFVDAVTDDGPTEQEGEKLDRCVESVLEDNPDMTESQAYAICTDQLDGKAGLPSTCRECGDRERTYNTMRCPECHPEMDTDDHPPLVSDVGAKADTGTDAVVFSNFGGDPFADQDTLESFLADLDAVADTVWIGDDKWPSDDYGIHDRPVTAVGASLDDARDIWHRYESEVVTLSEPREEPVPDAPIPVDEKAAPVDRKATFSEGDPVRWSWQDDTVHGRVAEVRPEQATVSGNTITGDDEETVYVIDEYDDRVGAYRRENVAKPESSLDESRKDLPPREDSNYVSEQAWESLTTTVSESDFTAREMDYMTREMDGVLLRARANEWILPDTDPVVYRYEIPDKYLDGRSEEFFVPNDGVADAARKVKEWREEHGDDVAGGAPDGEGTRRATQLIEHAERGEPLAIEYWREINAYHARHHPQGSHELDAEFEGEPWRDAGYVSHLNWGGDAGYEQAQRVVDAVDAVDQQAAVEMRGAVATEQSLSPQAITKAESNEVDLDALEGELRDAVEADDFYVYGKASIEQWDDDDPPTYIQMDALERALDRYFDSETAPGIISRHHQDIPVGRPVRAFEFEADTTLEIDGERYQFEAGDRARSHVEDADGDGRPELWLAANIDGETEMGKKTRVLAAQGNLDGFSVTVHRNRDEMTQEGRVVTDCDLHAVTMGTGEQIKNPGSEFDVASFKGPVERVAEVVRGLLT